MKLSIQRSSLLSLASQALLTCGGDKSIMDTLRCVQLTAEGTSLTITGTDLTVSSSDTAAADVAETGSLLVNAKAFYDRIKALHDGEVSLWLVGGTLIVEAGRIKYELSTIPADDFPYVPDWTESTEILKISGKTLSDMLKQVIPFVFQTDSRPTLNCVMMECENGLLRFVATNGHCLVISETHVECSFERMCLSLRSANILYKIAKEASEVELTTNGTTFFIKNFSYIASFRLSSDGFPSWRGMFSKTYDDKCTVNRKMLLEAVKAVSLGSGSDYNIKMSVGDGQMVLSSKSSESGTSYAEVDCDFRGTAATHLNHEYLINSLQSCPSDDVCFYFGEPLAPVVWESSSTNVRGIIMPMRDE